MAQRALMKGVNSAVFPGTQVGPLMHVIAAKAIAFGEAQRPDFTVYSGQVIANAAAMAEQLTARGYKLVSGGTDNHLMLIDLSDEPISGKDGEDCLGRAGITVNKNTVPGERRSPFVTSGIRVGTPALTTRGMKEAESVQIGDWIADALHAHDDAAKLSAIREKVVALCRSFPIYPGWGS